MLPPGTDIICFALSKWDSPISSPAWSIAKELAKSHRVFYIDHPYSLKDVIAEWNTPQVKTRAQRWFGSKPNSFIPLGHLPGLRVVVPPITIPVNFIPEGNLYNRMASINDARLMKMLSSLVSEFDIQRFVFLNFFDPFFLQSLPGKLKPWKYVYQCMDDISEVNYTARHGVRLEKQIVQHCDLAIVTSTALLEKYKGTAKDIKLIPNGVDPGLFEKAYLKSFPKPSLLLQVQTHVIGFTGSIDYRTDFALLDKVFRSHPDKTFFFVGPVNTEEYKQYGIDQLPNVVFAGAMPIDHLPPYLQYFDAAIIPYKKNKLTSAIYPLKLNEYLAAGVPVISTDFSTDVKSFSDVIFLAGNAEDFSAAISHALLSNTESLREQRYRTAMENTWERRVDSLLQYMNV